MMEAVLVTRLTMNTYNRVELFETCIPPLKNVQQPERFVF